MINCKRIDRLVRRPYPVQYTCIFRFLPPTVGRVIEGAESEVFQGNRLEKRQVRSVQRVMILTLDVRWCLTTPLRCSCLVNRTTNL